MITRNSHAGTEIKKPLISETLNRLTDAIGLAKSTLTGLRTRLEPILRKADKEEGLKSTVKLESRNSELAKTLETNLRDVEAIKDQVKTIIDNLEI